MTALLDGRAGTSAAVARPHGAADGPVHVQRCGGGGGGGSCGCCSDDDAGAVQRRPDGDGAAAGSAVQRQVAGDATRMSISPTWAEALTDAELASETERLRRHLAGPGRDGPEAPAVQQNLRVLEADARRRGASARGTSLGEVPRPRGVPAGQGVMLRPITDMPGELLAAIPEGEVVELTPAMLAAARAGGGGAAPPARSQAQQVVDLIAREGEIYGPAAGSALRGLNAASRVSGLAAAGDFAIGLVGIPRTQMNPLAGNFNMLDVAAPLDYWGHTAVYVRQNGRITLVRGFNPDAGSLRSLAGLLRNSSAIESGTAAMTSVVSDDAYLFASNAARSMEYRIAAELAARYANELSPTGLGESVGAPGQYTARPSEWARLHPEAERPFCVASNCGQWAVEQVERRLGGPVGRTGQGTVTALGEGGATVPGTASQGRIMRLMGDVETAAAAGRSNPVSGMPGAVGGAGPVAGSVPMGIRVMRIGGRVFLVGGIAAGAYEVYAAPPEERARTATGVGGGFAGGFALGATAGLICAPGALVCSVVAGLALGFVGALGGREMAEGLFDAANPRGTPVTDPAQIHAAFVALQDADSGVCPSCHDGPGAATGAAGGTEAFAPGLDGLLDAASRTSTSRSGAVTPEEVQLIRSWLGAGAR